MAFLWYLLSDFLRSCFTHRLNLDLQIHLYRLPQDQWLGLETVQQYGEDGIGLTSSVSHDIDGSFGCSKQILTLRAIQIE